MVVEIPHHEPAITVHVDVPRGMVALPGDEHEPAAADLAHKKVLPCKVTVVKRLRQGTWACPHAGPRPAADGAARRVEKRCGRSITATTAP